MMRSALKSAAITAFASAAVFTSGVARSATAPEHPTTMTDLELARVRGGYLSANGITFGFGAVVSTSIDGVLALQTQLTVTDTGVSQSQSVGTPQVAAAVNSAVSAALGGLSGKGVVISGDGGASTVIQSLTGNQILNVVLNTASNRMITQNTAVTITLPAFNQLQQNAAAEQLSSSLLSAVGVGAVGAIRH